MTGTGITGAVAAESQQPVDVISDTGQIITDTSQSLLGFASFSEIIMYLFLALSLAGVGLTVWARLDDRKKGRN